MNSFYCKLSLILAILCSLISINLKAQDTSFTPSHLKAAQELLISTEILTTLTNSINSMLKAKIANMPEEEQKVFSDAMKPFFAKYLSWDLLKNDMAKVYATEFSEVEIKELNKFYQSPLGKKMIQKVPSLIQKEMVAVTQILISHQTELQEMLKAAAPQN